MLVSCRNDGSKRPSSRAQLLARVCLRFLCFRMHIRCKPWSHVTAVAIAAQNGCPGGGPGVLWSVAPRLVWFLLGYAAAGTWLTTSLFGRRLMRLHFGILRREGDLRFDLVRVRENAGAVPDALSQLRAIPFKADLLHRVGRLTLAQYKAWTARMPARPGFCFWPAHPSHACLRARHRELCCWGPDRLLCC